MAENQVELRRGLLPGTLVCWTTPAGERQTGLLREYGDGTAAVTTRDGSIKTVRCDSDQGTLCRK